MNIESRMGGCNKFLFAKGGRIFPISANAVYFTERNGGFYKNINLNYSIGKMRWQPWAEKCGCIATNATTFNRELLIVERANDGKPFEPHTSYEDKESYYRNLRNPWLLVLFMFTVFTVVNHTIVFGILALIFLIPVLLYQVQIAKNRRESKAKEW